MKTATFSTIRKRKANDYIFEVTILICITESGFSELVIQFIITRNNDELGELTVSKIAHKLIVISAHPICIIYSRAKKECLRANS